MVDSVAAKGTIVPSFLFVAEDGSSGFNAANAGDTETCEEITKQPGR
jgi:hypothetical protein